MLEQRRFMRTASEALVEISHPSMGVIELKARDLSEGGVFVHMGIHSPLPVGTIVKARIKRYTGVLNAEPVDMQVVHQQDGGMGLKFV